MRSGCSPNQAWAILYRHAREDIGGLRLQELCRDEDRIQALMEVYSTTENEIWVDFTRQRLTSDTIFHLLRLATSVQLRPYIRSLSSHNDDSEEATSARTTAMNPYLMLRHVRGRNEREWNRIETLSDQIRRGQKRSASGSNLTNLLLMGDGSPFSQVVMNAVQFFVQALSVTISGKDALCQHTAKNKPRQVRFCHDFHPITVLQTIQEWSPSDTIIILFSFDHDNQQQKISFFQQWFSSKHNTSNSTGNSNSSKVWKKQIFIIQRGSSSISPSSPQNTTASSSFSFDHASNNNNIFTIPSHLHPATITFTCAGLLPLSILFGWKFAAVPFLQGAHDMDCHFTDTNPRHNIPVLLALVDTWNQILSSPTIQQQKSVQIIDPSLSGYSAMLSSMETLQNSSTYHNNDQTIVPATSTTAATFHHRSTFNNIKIPTEFIVSMDSTPTLTALAALNIHHRDTEFAANNISICLAHADVLAFGSASISVPTTASPTHLMMEDDGNHPSTIIICSHINAYMCGQIIAMTEHRTMIRDRLYNHSQSFSENNNARPSSSVVLDSPSTFSSAIPIYHQVLEEKWVHMKHRLYSGKTALPEDDEDEEENGHDSRHKNYSNMSQYNMATNMMMSHVITRSLEQQYQTFST